MIFDEGTTRDLADALRLLEGRVQGTGRRLSPGAIELRNALLRSGLANGGQSSASGVESWDVPDVPTLLTRDAVAERLSVSPRTVRRLIATGALSSVRIAGQVRVDPRDLSDYLDRNRTGGAA